MTQMLVTGASGFIGSHVVRRLNARGHRPRVLVRPTSNRTNLADLDAEVVEGDLLDVGSVRQALAGCDQLFHIAGYVSPKPSERQRMFDSNVQATINIMDVARELEVSRIVYLGSVTGQGASTEPVIWQAGSPYNLGGTGVAYFDSKREGELAVQERIKAGLPVIGAYPAYCLGPGDVYLSSSKLVTTFVQGKIPFYTRAGMGFLDVRDAAEAIVLAMEKGRVGEGYYLSGHNITYGEFFQRLAAIIGRPAPRFAMPLGVLRVLSAIFEPLTDGDLMSRSLYMALARYYWYDNSKAEQELGWSFRPLEEMLQDSVAWLKEAGHI